MCASRGLWDVRMNTVTSLPRADLKNLGKPQGCIQHGCHWCLGTHWDSTMGANNNFATISDTCAHFTQVFYWTKGHAYQLIFGF